jgi:hypothetical protein
MCKLVMENETPINMQTELIRAFQIKEGNSPCFATIPTSECNEEKCYWKHDCFDVELDNLLKKAFGKAA